MRSIFGTMLCAAAVLSTSAAQAIVPNSVPVGCQETSFTQRAYLSGFQQGVSLVDRAWLMVNDCDNLERFSDIVVANVESYVLGGQSTYVVCRYTGLTDGVYARLDEVWLQCGGNCCDEGAVIGELAAEIYCQLSILLDGLAAPDLFVRRPVHTCGLSFEMCCDASYDAFSTGFPACLPYTADPHDIVWDETRVMQCAYTPEPETVP